MEIEVALKAYTVNYAKVEKNIKILVPSYEGMIRDTTIRFQFTEELSQGQIDAVNNYWDGLTEEYFQPTGEEAALNQQKHQREWGQVYILVLIDKVGARNLYLASQGQTVDVAALLVALGGVKELLNTGALKTAIGLLTYHRPNYAAYDDIFEEAISAISGFLVANGYQ